MNRNRILLSAVSTTLFCLAVCQAEEGVQFKLTPSGFASMEIGQMIKSGVNKKTGRNMDNTWMRQIIAGMSANASLSERSLLKIGLEMQMYNDFPIDIAFSNPAYRYLYFYPYLS